MCKTPGCERETKRVRGSYCGACTSRKYREKMKAEDPNWNAKRAAHIRARRLQGKEVLSEATKAKRMERQRARRAADPAKAKSYKYKRRELIKGKTDLDYVRLIQNDTCVYCGGESKTIDHIVAISKGGGSGSDNLAPACRSCNSKKQSMTVLEFMLRISNEPIK